MQQRSGKDNLIRLIMVNFMAVQVLTGDPRVVEASNMKNLLPSHLSRSETSAV